MSGVISIDVESVKRAPDCNVHFVPCEIDYNGQAKVQEYFSSSISESTESPEPDKAIKGKGLTATFRGRPLDGEIKEIPSGYTGIVLKESRKTFTDDEERKLTATSKFSKFHFWNLDKKPAKDDRLHQVLEWMEIAKVASAKIYGTTKMWKLDLFTSDLKDRRRIKIAKNILAMDSHPNYSCFSVYLLVNL